MRFFKNPRFGKYWKVPYFSLFSLLPMAMLYEESNNFWIPFYFVFLLAIFTRRTFKPWIVPICTSTGIIIGAIHYIFVAQIDLLFFARLLLFIHLGLHLLEIQKERVMVIYFINFVLVLVASALSFKFRFAVYLIAFLFLMGHFCLELQFLSFQEVKKEPGRHKYTLKLILFLIISGYLCFLLFPRVKFDKFPSQIGMSISGFSESVTFEDMTNILESDQVLMRVKSQAPPTYYRGITLDHYDGRTWSNSRYSTLMTRHKYTEDGALIIAKSPYEFQRKDTRKYEFQLLPSKNKVLFLPPYTFAVDVDPPTLRQNSHGDIRRNQALTKNLEYIAHAAPPPKDRSIFQDDPEINKKIRERYLQLPDDVSDPVRKLASVVTRGRETYYEKVQAVLESFGKRGYTYSLRSSHPGNPLEDFLLRNKVGHCQYFAGAMVLLLRLNGIPARMVNGFNSGEYNEWGDYFTIRYRDAHAWVEVYAGNGLWITRDPTPAAPPSWYGMKSLSELMAQWKKIEEYLDSKWQDYVIYFSRLDQHFLWLKLMEWWNQNRFLNSFLILFVFSLALFLFRVFFLSFQLGKKSSDPIIGELDRFFHEIGLERPENLSLKEFSSRLPLHENIKDRIDDLIRAIYSFRYDPASDKETLRARLVSEIRSLRKIPRNQLLNQ